MKKRKKNKLADATPPAPKVRQMRLVEDKVCEEIENAAQAYVEQRDARMELTEKESAAATQLCTVMRKHGKESYTHGRFEITLSTIDKIKVKTPKEDKE